jgi:hypothetical protein
MSSSLEALIPGNIIPNELNKEEIIIVSGTLPT